MSHDSQPHDHGTPEPLPRRDFLKVAGFSTAAGLALAGCGRQRTAGEPALPYAEQPEGVIGGRPVWYASTCAGCGERCGLLAKCVDGRPIKLEGNPAHPLNRGRLCAVGQAQVLGVYDSQRLAQPQIGGQAASWEQVDQTVLGALTAARDQRRAVRLLTDTRSGPTSRWAMQQFCAAWGDCQVIVSDALSHSAVGEAHLQTHGVRAWPRLHLARATVVVGVESDFLGSGVAPVEQAADWSRARDLAAPDGRYLYHFQAEARLSLTGAKADQRLPLRPGAAAAWLQDLLNRVARRLGAAQQEATPKPDPRLDELADRLVQARSSSVVLCGLNDLTCQLLANGLNLLLGSYGSLLDLNQSSFQRLTDDAAVVALREELAAGQVGVLLLAGVNPLADLPDGAAWDKLLRAVPLTVQIGERVDETSAACRVLAPEPHFLEAWGDAEPVNGVVSVQQPVIQPRTAARSLVESLSVWSNRPQGGEALVQTAWQAAVWSRRTTDQGWPAFWDQALANGCVEVRPVALPSSVPQALNVAPPPVDTAPLELVLYAKVGQLDGRHAWNPWLQELPDPISKVSWDNYAALAPETAAELHLLEGDEVELTAGGARLKLPVLLQTGQAPGTVAVALGYGRAASRRFAAIGPRWIGAHPSVNDQGLVGGNAAPLRRWADGRLLDWAPVTLQATGRRLELARAQTQESQVLPAHLAPAGDPRREIVQATTLAAFRHNPQAGAEPLHHGPSELWGREHTYPGHRWTMVIDLNACTGCSACVLACQVENNIPVVGRDEVRRRREMHWLRLDRYLDPTSAGLDVAFQPMLCHHCDNAPCEVVCPVLATVHSAEGLNQQVYNRCVGTRYCANNCPYKVRRFNWFNYPHDDPDAELVLNPDVTVRTRGVMEKCTFCVQRLEAAKAEAARTGQPLRDADVQPACAQSCPAGAIWFGDRNDPNSAVARALADPRRYRVLEELGVEPAVNYLRVVRNAPAAAEESHHG
ncbi:MAG: 4Fe-4S dicluster domain-containing protein [Fimbriimonadaceae bacterium]|nr:4Fe-4S dicluster domain-containing protein [Fimbriimonadaceae bacterium]